MSTVYVDILSLLQLKACEDENYMVGAMSACTKFE